MRRRLVSARASQRGYMLMLVLVALVAMMISGVALVRSMDTNQLVAGNMASRNSTIHSADLAVQQAVNWIQANATNGVLFADAPASGYQAEEQEPTWTLPATWSQCTTTSGLVAERHRVVGRQQLLERCRDLQRPAEELLPDLDSGHGTAQYDDLDSGLCHALNGQVLQ